MARKDFISPKWSAVNPQLKLRWSPHSIDLFQRDIFSWWWTDVADCGDFVPTVANIYGTLWGNFRQRIMWLRARYPEGERDRLREYCLKRTSRELIQSKITLANQAEADKPYRSSKSLLRNISEWFDPKNDDKCWNSPWELVLVGTQPAVELAIEFPFATTQTNEQFVISSSFDGMVRHRLEVQELGPSAPVYIWELKTHKTGGEHYLNNLKTRTQIRTYDVLLSAYAREYDLPYNGLVLEVHGAQVKEPKFDFLLHKFEEYDRTAHKHNVVTWLRIHEWLALQGMFEPERFIETPLINWEGIQKYATEGAPAPLQKFAEMSPQQRRDWLTRRIELEEKGI
jgi:hypothetical protein